MDVGVVGLFESAGDGDPREELRGFLLSVRDLLHALIQESLGEEVFEEVLLDDLRSAWPDVQEHFESALRLVADVRYADLHMHGLVGSQLRLKLSVVRFYYRRFLETARRALDLKKLLNPIDVVLNSVAAIIPPVAAIAEFKEMTHCCIR